MRLSVIKDAASRRPGLPYHSKSFEMREEPSAASARRRPYSLSIGAQARRTARHRSRRGASLISRLEIRATVGSQGSVRDNGVTDEKAFTPVSADIAGVDQRCNQPGPSGQRRCGCGACRRPCRGNHHRRRSCRPPLLRAPGAGVCRAGIALLLDPRTADVGWLPRCVGLPQRPGLRVGAARFAR